MPSSSPHLQILQANAKALPLADNSVDLIVTSPPYFSLRHYQDDGLALADQIGTEKTPQEYLESLWQVTAECHRVLKPTGSLFFNIMDKYNSAASNQNGLGATLQGGKHEANRIGRGRTVDLVPTKSLLGLPWRYALGLLDNQTTATWVLRSDMIWNKTNGMPDPVQDRAQRKHEYLFHFTKRQQYFSNPKIVKTMHSVWNLPTQRPQIESATKHPAPFPIALPDQLIKAFCPAAGTVLDPFGGSGTTALAALKNNRAAISVDLSEEYCQLAKLRCNQVLKHPSKSDI